jgi:hypothetical protein
MMGKFFYASLIGYLDLGYDIYKFVTKVLIWNDMSRAMQNPLLYMLKTSHDEPHGVWTLIIVGLGRKYLLNFTYKSTISVALSISHMVSSFFIALDFSMVWENNNGVLVLRSFHH